MGCDVDFIWAMMWTVCGEKNKVNTGEILSTK